MAPIGSSHSSSTTSGQAGSASSAAADQNMFLQLLVTQLKNQDPANPVDGTAFVTQLAQFQQLDESLSMGADISAIRQDLANLLSAGGSSSATGDQGAVGAIRNA